MTFVFQFKKIASEYIGVHSDLNLILICSVIINMKIKYALFTALALVSCQSIHLKSELMGKIQDKLNNYTAEQIETFRKVQLERHNWYRMFHSSPPLQMSDQLSQKAQQWAEHLALTHQFGHSFKSEHLTDGENLYQSSNQFTRVYRGGEATDEWYSEGKNYDFDQPGFSSGTGHFSQLVWKVSKWVGFGFGYAEGKVYVVAEYDPPGNQRRFFAQNVLPKVR